MLSEKKSIIGQRKIDFLGMKISHGTICPGPHLAEQLSQFPDDNLSVKEIQQFLGIINYIRDFIPHASQFSSTLSQLLKKKPPPWGPDQTQAVRHLKEAAKDPPPLTIPSTGNLILQLDASDHYWGVFLLEDKDNKRAYCGHVHAIFLPLQETYVHLDDLANQKSLFWTFLQLFDLLLTWRRKLTTIMGNHNLWKMVLAEAAAVYSIVILHRPYFYNSNRNLLWSQNQVYEWDTLYNFPSTWPSYKPSLLKHLCEMNSLQFYSELIHVIPDKIPAPKPPDKDHPDQDPMDTDEDYLWK
ncbi:uncharacterized protein LOC131147932 [Malania oleifera]|uniref:uncharacterized protein LOC131147932 n=1 Tax=Malania oleifera TaxID=397392 RepID=UPI0025ADDA92|nr:uncharacterized protein LOC131147932 [Malania oleifera]